MTLSDDGEGEMHDNTDQSDEIDQITDESIITSDPITDSDSNPRRYLRRQTKKSTRLNDYYCSFATSNGRSTGTKYPMHDYLTYKRLSTSHTNYLDKISTTNELSPFQQASLSPEWVKAMNEKLVALELNDT